jgi:membrane associated rhomboid family serine protease
VSSLRQLADEVPVTLLVLLAFVTMAFLTDSLRPTGEQLDACGWLTPLAAAHGEPWRLVTYAFLHGGFLHIAFNTMMLLGAGPGLERALGSLRFAAVFVVSAVGGGIAVCLFADPHGPVVGGSGALFGLCGAALALVMRSGSHAFEAFSFEGPRRLVAMIVANLVIGWILPFVSNTAHLGGLAAGFGLTFLFLVPPRLRSRTLWHWRAATAALFAGWLFAALVPVTRYDWLWNQGVRSVDAARQEALARAAVMAWLQQPTTDDAALQRFVDTVLRPKPTPNGPDAPRGR